MCQHRLMDGDVLALRFNESDSSLLPAKCARTVTKTETSEGGGGGGDVGLSGGGGCGGDGGVG